MASNKLSFLMERKKNPKTNKNGTDDEDLAFVKAAAWAWYQHSSGSDQGKVTTSDEFNVTRTHRAPSKPSRYKLEAMNMAKEERGSPIHDNKVSLLLDAYEVQSISRQLNSLLESNSNHNKVTTDNSTDASVDIGGRRMNKKKKKKKIRKGFWLNHVAVCGRKEDVVDPSTLRKGHRQSAKHVPAVKCLPITN